MSLLVEEQSINKPVLLHVRAGPARGPGPGWWVLPPPPHHVPRSRDCSRPPVTAPSAPCGVGMGRVLSTQGPWARIKQWTLAPSDLCPLHSGLALVWSHPSTFALDPVVPPPPPHPNYHQAGQAERNCRAAGGQPDARSQLVPCCGLLDSGPLCSPVASGSVPDSWEVAEVSWE